VRRRGIRRPVRRLLSTATATPPRVRYLEVLEEQRAAGVAVQPGRQGAVADRAASRAGRAGGLRRPGRCRAGALLGIGRRRPRRAARDRAPARCGASKLVMIKRGRGRFGSVPTGAWCPAGPRAPACPRRRSPSRLRRHVDRRLASTRRRALQLRPDLDALFCANDCWRSARSGSCRAPATCPRRQRHRLRRHRDRADSTVPLTSVAQPSTSSARGGRAAAAPDRAAGPIATADPVPARGHGRSSTLSARARWPVSAAAGLAIREMPGLIPIHTDQSRPRAESARSACAYPESASRLRMVWHAGSFASSAR